MIVFFVCVAAYAQNDNSSPPPLNPYDSPWGEPSSPPISPPGSSSGDMNTPSPPPSDPFGQTAPSYDGDDDFDPQGFGGFSGSNGGTSQQAEGKSSFMLVEPSTLDACQSWGSQMLSKQTFSDFSDCQFQLERKLEQTQSAIEQNIDLVERFKLKQMLKGEIDNEMRKKNQVQFSSLEKRLKAETKKGCSCVKK